MPLPTEGLTPDSSDEEIKAAIAGTIAQLIQEGRERDQAVAIAFDTARRATGKSLSPETVSPAPPEAVLPGAAPPGAVPRRKKVRVERMISPGL